MVGVLAGQFNQIDGLRGAEAGVIHMRSADLHGDLHSDLNGLDDVNASMDAQVNVTPSPMASFASVFAPAAMGTGQTQTAQTQDNMRDLKQQFTALTTTSAIWNPTQKLNNDQVAKGVETNRAEGHAKANTATQAQDNIREQAADLTKRMNALDAGNDGPSGMNQPGGLGAFVAGEAKGAAAVAAVSTVSPTAGAALATIQLVSMMGRGTFGMMNQGDLITTKVDRKGHAVDAGYGRGDSAPSSPAGPQQNAAQPQSQTMFNQMSKGPGFGDPKAMMDMDEGRVGLSGAGLRDVARINIEQTPAMKAYESMRLDGVNVAKLHEARQQNGIAADADNVAKANALSLEDPAMRGQAMRMSGAMM
ncbi:hypothetical protein A11S_58 [Micavibrio aeruginosavorus EPB]|uniref:Uncharacterized protein n=1 Tax=Micavibrio aeruginosavorus EPB TaxID=349215 RepID=M4VFR5_9BACT|nr:hypothetical protein A11S_58 [Micavibrio aeruginosavorus EPB]